MYVERIVECMEKTALPGVDLTSWRY